MTTRVSEFQVHGIQVSIYPNKSELAQAAAVLVAERIRQAIAERGVANVIFATGASQYEFLAHLISLPDIAWPKVTAFHLDEYIGISDQHSASFRRFLHERLFDHLPFGAVHVLQGDAPDPEAEARRYAALLPSQPDLACIGVGENSHLAFNDPPADFDTPNRVHVVNLDDRCRQQQVGEGHFPSLAAVPPQALSLSIPAILSARTISCMAPDRRKAEAIRCALDGPLSPLCPASALRLHADCHLFLDPASAALLAPTTAGSGGHADAE